MPAIALAQDTSTITACGNDLGYDALFERTVRALGRDGDIILAISTSGKSESILRALAAARQMNIRTFGFLGSGGGPALALCDRAFVVPGSETGRIQEAHITAGHALIVALCGLTRLSRNGRTRIGDQPSRSVVALRDR